MASLTRRNVLGSIGGLVGTGLAGCSSLPGTGGGSSTSIPSWANWIPSWLVRPSDSEFTINYLDLQRIHGEFPERARPDTNLRDLAFRYGTEPESFEAMIGISLGPPIGGTVYTGSFDLEALRNAIRNASVEETYEGFERIANDFEELVASGDAIVESGEYESMIDANLGTRDRVYEVDERWESVLRDVSGSDMVSIRATPGWTPDVFSYAIDARSDEHVRMTGRAYYSSPDAVPEDLHSARDLFEDGTDDESVEIQEGRPSETVVTLEADVTDLDMVTLNFD